MGFPQKSTVYTVEIQVNQHCHPCSLPRERSTRQTFAPGSQRPESRTHFYGISKLPRERRDTPRLNPSATLRRNTPTENFEIPSQASSSFRIRVQIISWGISSHESPFDEKEHSRPSRAACREGTLSQYGHLSRTQVWKFFFTCHFTLRSPEPSPFS